MKYLIYVTKAKPYLLDVGLNEENPYEVLNNGDSPSNYAIEPFNGHIVAEFEGKVEEIIHEWLSCKIDCYYAGATYDYQFYLENKLLELSCLDRKQLEDYLGVSDEEIKKVGYAIHINNLKVFDEPLELSEVERLITKSFMGLKKQFLLQLTKAPQNMCWVWYKGERYCLISIRPQWVCKILNGEKTIEIRKKILKGML